MLLSNVLRRAITESGVAFKSLEELTEVSRDSISRFVGGETSLYLEQADRLATVLKLELTPAPKEGQDVQLESERRKPWSIINSIVDRFNVLVPGMDVRQTGGTFANMELIEPYVRLQVLFRRGTGPSRVEAGLAFDDASARLNEQRANHYRQLLREELAAGVLQDRPTASGSNRYLIRSFTVPPGGPSKTFIEEIAQFTVSFRQQLREFRA